MQQLVDEFELNGEPFIISTVELTTKLNLLDVFLFGEMFEEKYETMIFLKGEWHDLYCERYVTEKEAVKRHKELLEGVVNGTNSALIEDILNAYKEEYEEEE